MKIDGIIFDLDGTLWDARENICISWNKAIAERYPDMPLLTAEQLSAQMGKLLPDIGKALFTQLEPQESNELIEACCEYENEYVAEHGGVLYPELEKTLAQLSGKYRLYIVSNCQAGYIEAFLKAHNMGKYFEDIECHGSTGLLKADNIKLIVERHGLKAPVYVGDTALDGASAAQAGVPFIWASYGFGTAEEYIAKAETPRDIVRICDDIH